MQDINKPFVGGITLQLGSGSPASFEDICDATTIGGVGKTNTSVPYLTLCSRGNTQYAPGASEGAQITVDSVFIMNSAIRQRLIEAVDNREVLEFRIAVDPDATGTPVETHTFEAAALSYVLQPSGEALNTVQFTFQVSGDIAHDFFTLVP